MQGSAGHRVWIGAAAALIYGLVLTWGLLRFGAAESTVLSRLFLFLLVPAILALVAPPWRAKIDARFFALILLGLYLLGQLTLQPTLESRGYLLLSVGWIALWFSLWLAIRSESQRRFLLVVLVLLGALEAFYGLVQSVGGFDYIGDYFRNMDRIATGSLINRNHYAALLNMLLPLAIGMLFADQALKRSQRATRSESLAKTWIVLLGCSCMGVAVLLSQSRGGTLSLLLTLLFVAVLLTLSRKARSRRGLTGAAAGLLLFLVVGMGAAFGLEALLERFDRIDENLSRVEVYRDTAEMIADSPIVGVGPGMYQWRFRLYQQTQPNTLYDHAHNDYLETASEWGIPLALLAWGFIFWRFYRSSELALSAKDPRQQGLALGTAGALFSILIHSLVDFSLQIPAVLMVFCSILALSWSLEFDRAGPAASSGSSPAAAGTGLAVVLRVLLIGALLAAGYQTFQRSRADRAAQPANGVSGLEQATQHDPMNPVPQYLLGMVYRDLPGVGDLTTAAQHLQQAVRLNPYAWRYWQELSRAQELLGDLDQAEASLRVAVTLNAGSGEYHWRLANLLVREGNLKEAVDEIAAAVALEPHLAEPAVILLLKFGVEAKTVIELLPTDRAALVRVFRALLNRPTSAQAVSVGPDKVVGTLWERLLADPQPLTIPEGRLYLDHLFRSGEYDEARRAWIRLAQTHGLSDPEFEGGSKLVWNGDFEFEIMGAPLGWKINKHDSFEPMRSAGLGTSGSAGLKIEFHGTENLSFSHVSQQMILEPGATYALTVKMRSEDLSTDQGVFVEVLSRNPNGSLAATDPILGTHEWTSLDTEFTMPEGSGLAMIRLRRNPSQQIDSRVRGKVYMDSVTIKRVSP